MKRSLFLIAFCLLLSAGFANGQQFTPVVNNNTTDSSSTALLIPNAFTPNQDGINDIFKIDNFSDQKLIEFKVFNRWGTILFQTNNPRVGWDGNYKGSKQPIGVYGYVIRIAYPNKVVETYKGTVTLLR